MFSNILKSFSLFMAIALVFFSCSGGEKEATTRKKTENTEKQAEQQVEKKKEMNPDELGQEIGDLYVHGLQEVTEFLKSMPEVSQVRPQVEEMKEMYVQKLVELGKQREALDASDKAKVDLKIRLKLSSTYSAPWYTTYNQVQENYFKDRDFHKIILSFNVIGQYANFDLLKKQEPEEAKRLGIE